VNCGAVRERLPEHALGVAGGRDGEAVDRHLAWCAACRKEARDLHGAVASLAYTLAPADPDPELEERVVAAVQGAAGRRRPPNRRGRLATVAALTAVLAVMGLGWGAVMAGRVARLSDEADRSAEQRRIEFGQLVDLFKGSPFSDPATEAFLGSLRPASGFAGSGAAMTLVSPTSDDQALVDVTGLQPGGRSLPYRVMVQSPRQTVRLGEIVELDADGHATVVRIMNRDIRDFDRVVVRDALGRVVLRGALVAETSVESPGP
jgi:hypothetical protein